MTDSHQEFLRVFGWSGFFESQLASLETDGLIPARVIGEERDLYRVQVDLELALPATVTGSLRFKAQERGDLPAVGDWVACTISGDRAVIHHVLGRRSLLQRRAPGGDQQILGTNVDYLLVATSMNADLNHRRLDRYLTLGWDSGAIPIVLLTKADLCESQEAVRTEVETRFPGVAVHAISVQDPSSFAPLATYLQGGKTTAVLGSSGVGKSTMTNFLLGSDVLKTQEIRSDDEKGRHTTTARYLFRCRREGFDGLIMDTPGMRELQMMDQGDGLQKQFEDVDAMVLQCRFSDCEHRTEPGCRVLAALAASELDQDRWHSYQKLLREIRAAERREDKALASAEKAKWKQVSKDLRRMK